MYEEVSFCKIKDGLAMSIYLLCLFYDLGSSFKL